MLAAQVVDHAPHRVLGGCPQLGADSIGRVIGTDVGGGCQRARGEELRRADVHVLAHGQADRGVHRRLDRRSAHLAVPLGSVAVSE